MTNKYNEDKGNKRVGKGEDILKTTLQAGIHGPPQLKKEEKRWLLGQFRERVLKALTFKQIEEIGTYPEVKEALLDPRAHRLIISSKVNLKAAREYIQLARKKEMPFTTTSSPDFMGDIGLIVVAKEAVEEEEILVPNREEKLKEKGVPIEIIKAVGQKICPACYELLLEKAPEEALNYKKAGFLDKLLGLPCPRCS